MLPPEAAWLPQSQLSEKALLFNEMDGVFENGLRWIAEADGSVRLNVEQDPSHSRNLRLASGAVAARVILAKRKSRDLHWTPVWAVDVVAREEEVVRLTPDESDALEGAEMALWAYTLDDDVIAVDCDLSHAGLEIKSSFSGVQQTGVPLMLPAIKRSDAEYRVFQTVVMLHNKA